jgi:hypothetical protein
MVLGWDGVWLASLLLGDVLLAAAPDGSIRRGSIKHSVHSNRRYGIHAEPLLTMY